MACKSGRSYDSHTYSFMRNSRIADACCRYVSHYQMKVTRKGAVNGQSPFDRHRAKETGANIPKSDMAYNKSIHNLIR